MSAVGPLLGAAWALVVVAGGWVRRPRRRRVEQLVAPVSAFTPERVGPAGMLGAAVLRALRRPADPVQATVVGRAALAGGLAAVVSPWLAVVAVGGVVGWARMAAGRARRRRDRVVADQLPDVIDLLVLAAGAGLNVTLAVAAVGRFAEGDLAAALAEVARDQTRGRRLADGLAQLPVLLGEAVRPLTDALVDADRYGTPLLPVLETLVVDVRQQRRRRAEDRARQAPVRLIFPLVLCALPAFALLTVVPLLLATLRSFRH